jgi:hypothetical protein
VTCAQPRGPGHERHAVGQRQPGDGGAGSCTGEAGEERDGRDRVGWPVGRPTEWGPTTERKVGVVAVGGPTRRWGPTGKEREVEGVADMRGCGV